MIPLDPRSIVSFLIFLTVILGFFFVAAIVMLLFAVVDRIVRWIDG